jgi:hypothetical protein
MWPRLRQEEVEELAKCAVFAFYSVPNIIGVIKSRRMELARHVARVGERDGADVFYVGKLRRRDHLDKRGVEGRINLKKDVHKIERLGDEID